MPMNPRAAARQIEGDACSGQAETTNKTRTIASIRKMVGSATRAAQLKEKSETRYTRHKSGMARTAGGVVDKRGICLRRIRKRSTKIPTPASTEAIRKP